MRIPKSILICIVIAVSAPVLAQETCLQRERSLEASTKSPADAIRELAGNDCLGGDKDKSDLATRVSEVLSGKDGKAAFAEAVGIVNKSLLDEIAKAERDIKVPDLSPDMRLAATKAREVLVKIQARVKAVLDQVAAAGGKREEGEVNWRFVSRAFQLPPAGPDAAPIRLKAELLDPVCKTDPAMNKIDESCRDAFGTVATVLRHATLVGLAYSVAVTGWQVGGADTAAAALKVKWDNYFEQPRHQFLWEAAVNSVRYHRQIEGSKGLQDPPTDQIILFHPSVALEYISKAPKGSRFEPALLVEVVGYNRWRWGDDGKTKDALGVSLIASYSDRAALSSTRFGMMLHWDNDTSFGFTRRNGVTGIFMSADAAKLFGKVSDSTRKLFGEAAR